MKGQLGIGALANGTGDEQCPDANAYMDPQPVMPNTQWLTVSAGYMSTCAISVAHELWCWGFNEVLQVSNEWGDAFIPKRVNADTDWAEVAPGFFHTCAKKLDGMVWCMGGDGEDDDAGVGDFGFRNAPLHAIGF